MQQLKFLLSLLLVGLFVASSPGVASAQDKPLTREELKQIIREIVHEEIQTQQPAAPAGKATAGTKASGLPAVKGAPVSSTTTTTTVPAAKSDAEVSNLVKSEVSKQIAEQDPPRSLKAGPFALSVEGYGDLQFAHHDYSENGNPQENSRGQSRTTFDETRFTMEFEGKDQEDGIDFETEVEYEHGGTGSEKELDYDEFGEFENDVEKGGEVELEEFWIRKQFGDEWSARAGRFYVEVGLLSDYQLPTDYLGSERPETETTLIPGVWSEIGFELQKKFEKATLTVQLVNGLDSTGFSGANWISGGEQGSFEVNRAQDVAVVTRADFTPIPGLLVGASGYFAAATNSNRPKADIGDSDGGIVLGDAHARYWTDSLRAQGSVFVGHLYDANEISTINSRLSTNLEVPRTAVGDGAFGVWSEVGYNIAPFFDIGSRHRIDPFIRYEYYDTYADTRDNLVDTGKYERNVYTAGIAYTYNQFLTTKLDYSVRTFGEDDLSDQNTLRLGIGLVY